jgi:hypothetical protein
MPKPIVTAILTFALATCIFTTAACSPTAPSTTPANVGKCVAAISVTLFVALVIKAESAVPLLTQVAVGVCLDAVGDISKGIADSWTVPDQNITVNASAEQTLSKDIDFQGLTVPNCQAVENVSAVVPTIEVSAHRFITVGTETFTSLRDSTTTDQDAQIARGIADRRNVQLGQDLTADWTSSLAVPLGQKLVVSMKGQISLRAGTAALLQGSTTVIDNVKYSYSTALSLDEKSAKPALQAC